MCWPAVQIYPQLLGSHEFKGHFFPSTALLLFFPGFSQAGSIFKRGSLTTLPLSYLLQLLWENSKVFRKKMGDKSPPVCPGYALRSTSSWKMPQTPYPVYPPTAHQLTYKPVDRKVPNSHSSFKALFIYLFIFIFAAFSHRFYQNQL